MTSLTEVKVPDIGDFSDIEIIEVHVATGDPVEADALLITLESDKATMDVPAPQAGVVQEMKVSAGDRVSEGSVILLLEAAAEAAAHDPGEAAPAPDSGASPSVALDQDEDRRPVPPAVHSPPASLPPPVERAGVAPAHASPGVRRFARELGADLTQVRGSGPKGRILKDDIIAFVKGVMTGSGPASKTSPGAAAGIPPIPEVDFSKWGDIDVQPLPRIKKISGPHLHRAWLNVPHVTHHDEADVTELESFRQSLKPEAEKRGVRVTSLAFIMKAVAAGLGSFPQFNSSLGADGESLVFKRYVHVGIAVDTPNGLMVPVFRDVDSKGIFELAAEMADISARARDGKLKSDEMQGGCMSISSLGGIGGTAFTPIVNVPEVAILGVTRARMQPVWNGADFEPRLMLPLDLSYDHRVIDGADAARFMAYLCRLLGDVRRLLL